MAATKPYNDSIYSVASIGPSISASSKAEIELTHLTPTSSTATLQAPTKPPATSSYGTDDDDLDGGAVQVHSGTAPSSTPTAPFRPTLRLQVQAPGKRLLGLPVPPRPDPIPVFGLTAAGALHRPLYMSHRPTRGSGSCALAAADDPAAAPLSATCYRFGPGRHPRVTLFQRPGRVRALGSESEPEPESESESVGVGAAPVDRRADEVAGAACQPREQGQVWDEFEVAPSGWFTRGVAFRTRLGTFAWRYGTRRERRAAEADSLLLLERVVAEQVGTKKKKKKENKKKHGEEERGEGRRAVVVAQLVRNEAVRTPGTGPATAGNGGRLLLDESGSAEGGGEEGKEMLRVLVVTTCLVMLKREVDRRRAQQFAMLAAASSGGGS